MEEKQSRTVFILQEIVKIIGASLGLGLILTGFLSLFISFTESEITNLIKSIALLSFVLISHSALKRFMKTTTKSLKSLN